MSKIGTDKRKDWLLAEVEYLLRLANQRVPDGKISRWSAGIAEVFRSDP